VQPFLKCRESAAKKRFLEQPAAEGGKLEPFSDFADLSKNTDQGYHCVGITFKRGADAADSTSEARMLIFRQRPVCGFEDQRKHDATTTQNLYWQRE
jgi:hypothetical protein